MSNSKQQGGGHGHHRRPPCELKKGPFPPGSVPWCGHALRQLPARCPAAFPRDWLLLTACVCMLLLLLQGLLSSPFAAGGDATWQGRRRVLRERVHCTAPRRAGRERVSSVLDAWPDEGRSSGGLPPPPPVDPALWQHPDPGHYRPCFARDQETRLPGKPALGGTGYLRLSCNGGLNQMKAAICDMVAVAAILNVTLVLPELDRRSYWADNSSFSDVFDADHFIASLSSDIRIVKELPPELRDEEPTAIEPKSWSTVAEYRSRVLPLFAGGRVLHFLKTDARLANNGLPPALQRLRCRANYAALRFAPPIQQLAARLVARLRRRAPHYLALHLRFEKDMLAFTGCTHGLSAGEAEELRELRLATAHWKEKDINSTQRRAEGRCPLTPRETALFLQALGYPADTLVYVANGGMYGGDRRMRDFAALFPNVVSKEQLAARSELAPLARHATQLAAVDYLVSTASDVFTGSFTSNMLHQVQGDRAVQGFRKTLDPDRAQLVPLLDAYEGGHLPWANVSQRVQQLHEHRVGGPHQRRARPKDVKREETLYANPLPGCICDHKLAEERTIV